MPVTINARKFDRSIHRSWNAELVRTLPGIWLFRGVFEHSVDHDQLGFISKGTVSYEYYWQHRWFNVFRFHEPDGELRNWYCNVNMPPSFDGKTLDYIDLDLDILVWNDLRVEYLDRDDFEANTERFGYPPDVVAKAEQAVTEIEALIRGRDFPFDAGSI